MTKDEEQKRRRDLLKDQINQVQAGGTIKIYAGEMNCYVYDHPDIDQAIRSAKSRKVKQISVLIGPILSVRDATRETKVRKWVKEELITLYHRDMRYNDEHFRVFDRDGAGDKVSVYAEKPHCPLGEGEPIRFDDSEVRRWFETYSSDFDFYVGQTTLCTENLEKDLLLLTTEAIELVGILAEKKKGSGSYNYLKRPEIEELLKDFSDERTAGYDQDKIRAAMAN